MRHFPLADRDDLTESFLALVDEAFRRLLDEPDAHLHVSGFAEGDVAFVLTRDGLEARRRADDADSRSPPAPTSPTAVADLTAGSTTTTVTAPHTTER